MYYAQTRMPHRNSGFAARDLIGYSRMGYGLQNPASTSPIIPLIGRMEVMTTWAGQNSKARRF
jgi:hypothetical protein